MGNTYLTGSIPRLLKSGGGKIQSFACLLAFISWLYGPAVCAQASGPITEIQCYTLPPNAGAQNLTGTGTPATGQRLVVGNSSCTQYPEYAPGFQVEQGLPQMPIKTVRIMIHVFQNDNGDGNWQSPAQDGGADEALLRGLITGLPRWPIGSTGSSNPTVRGLNGIYSQLDERLTTYTPVVPATAPRADTRIRFQLEGIRYYRNSTYWNLSDNNPWGCGSSTNTYINNDNCLNGFYTTFITNSTASQDASGTALTPTQKTQILHIFLGENPGIPSTRLGEYGEMTTRFGTGGVTSGAPGAYMYCRGLYWDIKRHPQWSLSEAGFRYAEWVLAHEMGHCLGLYHVNGDDGCTAAPFMDPPASTSAVVSNNVMDVAGTNAGMPGFSLSQCQIGKMHYFLGHAGIDLTMTAAGGGAAYLDNMLVPDYCQHMTSEDVTIKPGKAEVWSSAHNLRGNLYIEPGASLTVRCRVGFVGPEAKIVVRGGGELILDNGTIGNYATSDQLECPDDLRLWLGGDGSDGDNSGLITIRNGGGFTSKRLNAVLTEGATLHIDPVPVLLDGCQLTTNDNSYLCVEPGATFSYARQAQLTIQPGTILGVNPTIPGNFDCEQSMCELLGRTVAFSASSVNAQGTVTPICPGDAITMTAQPGQPGATVSWFRNGASVAGTAVYSETPTGTAPIVYQAQVDFNNGCPPVTWSFTQTINPAATIQLLANSISLCGASTGGSYLYNGWFDLTTTTGSIRNPSATANRNTTYYWRDPAGNGLIGRSANSAGPFYFLRLADLRALGVASYPLQLCNQSTNPNIPCVTCATVTVNLDAGPAFTVPTPATLCPGQSVTLTASGPAGTTYQWQPGNLSGASVTVAPATNTTYTVTGTAASGCMTTKTVTVAVSRPTCLACLGNTYTDMNQAGTRTSFSGFTFLAGKTYVFNQDTEFNTGTFVIPEGTRLLFGPNVTLTLRNNGRLNLQGGMLTATCDEMWGGIVAEASSGGIGSQKPANLAYSEISHSRNGVIVSSNVPANTQPALQLHYVSFRHNGQGVQVQAPNSPGTPAFVGVIDHCLFDSDPRQMRSPWQYVSAQDLHVSLRHLALSGNCAGLTMSNTILDHALFGVWVPTLSPFTATNSVFQNIYVAGVYAHDALTSATHLTLNQFIYPPANNEIISSHSPQMRGVFNTDLAAEGPNSLLREGVCVGIFGPTATSTFTLQGNTFTQPTPLTSFDTRIPYPQYGVLISGGILRENIFSNLHIAYLSGSTQTNGEVKNNLFENCVYAVYFTNSQPSGSSTVGTATVSCNTFLRQPGVSGENYGIVRDYCQALGMGGACDQINFMTSGIASNGSPIYRLQKNKFQGPSSSAAPFYHVYNSSTNAPITYSTFSGIVPTIVVNSPALVFVDNAGVALTATTGSAIGNDCASEGFQYGLQGRSAGPSSSNGSSVNVLKDVFLAQNVPNPCAGTTSVSYRTPEGKQEVQLVIRDYFSGAVVQRQVVPAGEHTVEVNVTKLRPGGYHYALEVDGQPVAHHNLLVQ